MPRVSGPPHRAVAGGLRVACRGPVPGARQLVSTSGRAQRSGRIPRFEHRTAVGDGDGPRRGPGSASTSPAGPADLDGAAQAGTGPCPRTGRARRGPRPGRDSGRRPVALMATRLGPDGRVRGGARRRISPPRLQQAWQQRHGLLEVPCRDYPAAGRPAPARGSSKRPSGVLAHPSPGSGPPRPGGRPAAATGRRRAPSRPRPATEQTPRRHPPLVLPRGRLRAPPRRTRPVIPGPGPHRATRFPCPPRPRKFRGQSHVRHRAPRGHTR